MHTSDQPTFVTGTSMYGGCPVVAFCLFDQHESFWLQRRHQYSLQHVLPTSQYEQFWYAEKINGGIHYGRRSVTRTFTRRHTHTQMSAFMQLGMVFSLNNEIQLAPKLHNCKPIIHQKFSPFRLPNSFMERNPSIAGFTMQVGWAATRQQS